LIRRVIFLFTSVVALVSGLVAAQTNRSTSVEQTHFSAEDEAVKHPVIIPGDVLALLRQDGMVKDELEARQIPAGALPAPWFSASSIHLGGPQEKDLVVEAQGQLRGANVIMFWVFQPMPSGYKLVLKADGHDLIVRKKRLLGYRVIEISAETAEVFTSVLFRWDGSKYLKIREKSHTL
jgi:hypothetical protein